MIKSKAELQQVVEQMGRLYNALAELEQRVRPENPRLYAVMAEGPVDMLRELQAQVDEYVGLKGLREAEADVWLRLEGPSIAWENAPTSVLTGYVEAFRKGLLSVAEVMFLREGSEISPKRVREACDLRLLGLAPGSVQVGLKLPEESNEEPGELLMEQGDFSAFEEGASLGGRALRAYLRAARWASEEGDAWLEQNLTNSHERMIFLNAIRALLPRRRGMVDFVEVRGRSIFMPERYPFQLTRETHLRLDREQDRWIEKKTEKVEDYKGIVREIDLDGQTFLLREVEGARLIRCAFPDELCELAKDALDRLVVVSGMPRRRGRGGAGPLQVARMEIVDEQGDEAEGA